MAVIGPLKATGSVEASGQDIDDPDLGNRPSLTLGSIDDPEFHAIGQVASEGERGASR